MKKFVQVAKDLQMKKLAKNITMSIPPEYVDDLENNDHIYNKDIHTDNENQVENEYAGGGIAKLSPSPNSSLAGAEIVLISSNTPTPIRKSRKMERFRVFI